MTNNSNRSAGPQLSIFQRSSFAMALMGVVLCALVHSESALAEHDRTLIRWNNAALQAIRATRTGPPIAARALAIVHTAIYDAWAAYDPTAVGTRLGDTLRRPAAEMTQANKTQAISFAAYRALIDLFPSQAASFNDLMAQLGYDPANTSTDVNTPAGVGNVAAQTLLEFRHGDGANQLGGYADYTGYAPVNTPDLIVDPNRWQPLRLPNGAVQTFLAPHWFNVIPFALKSGAQFRPGPPEFFGSREFVEQARQIAKFSRDLNDRRKSIAEYWADGPNSETPPGHWCLLAQIVSARDAHTLDQDVKLFFALTNAGFDASIAAWDAKRAYDSVRPITALHFLFQDQQVEAWGGPGQGTKSIRGRDWQPYQELNFVTPPFAEYISGHSTFSMAAATVLRHFTGSDFFGASATIPRGSSKIEPGLTPAHNITLRWKTFTDAAKQAGLSRRYGGIHFEAGDLQGRITGMRVGNRVWRRSLAYFDPANQGPQLNAPDESVDVSLIATHRPDDD